MRAHNPCRTWPNDNRIVSRLFKSLILLSLILLFKSLRSFCCSAETSPAWDIARSADSAPEGAEDGCKKSCKGFPPPMPGAKFWRSLKKKWMSHYVHIIYIWKRERIRRVGISRCSSVRRLRDGGDNGLVRWLVRAIPGTMELQLLPLKVFSGCWKPSWVALVGGSVKSLLWYLSISPVSRVCLTTLHMNIETGFPDKARNRFKLLG